MKPKAVRLSIDDAAREKQIFDYYGVTGDNPTEQYRDFLKRCHQQIESYRKSETVKESEENLTPIFCKLRISKATKEGQAFFCVTKPPKAVKLVDLQVCKVCCALRYNMKLTEKTKVPDTETTTENNFSTEQPIEQTTPAITYQPVKGWDAFVIRADGAKVCPFGAAFVYKHNCQQCKRDEIDKWNACVMLHYQRQPSNQVMPSQKTN